jgi:hypothetical protein
MTRWRVTILGAALIALAAGWYVGSPVWTLWRMDEAAQARDWTTLASYVDEAVVREAWVARAIELRATEGMEEDGEAMLRETWPRILMGTIGNIPVRPGELVAGSLGLRSRLDRRGLNQFRIRNNGTPSPGTFVFRRHGLGWRLDEVRWGWPEGMPPP